MGIGSFALGADPVEAQADPSFHGLAEATISSPPAPVATPPVSLEAGFRALYRAQGRGTGLDRHRLRRRLTTSTPRPGVTTLILALEGSNLCSPC